MGKSIYTKRKEIELFSDLDVHHAKRNCNTIDFCTGNEVEYIRHVDNYCTIFKTEGNSCKNCPFMYVRAELIGNLKLDIPYQNHPCVDVGGYSPLRHYGIINRYFHYIQCEDKYYSIEDLTSILVKYYDLIRVKNQKQFDQMIKKCLLVKSESRKQLYTLYTKEAINKLCGIE